MSLAITAFHQITIMFIIILTGIVCYKTKLIDQDMNKKLSDLVLLFVNPLVIFISYQRKFEPGLLSGLLISLVLALITHVVAIILSRVVLRSKKQESDIALERFAMIYSNCGFIGIPLVNGILGKEGVFYLTAYMTVFNLLAFTHGVVAISGKKDKEFILKSILSPAIVATLVGFFLFLFKIILPDTIEEAFTYISDMNTPLAMLVAGVTFAQTDIPKLFGKLRIYYIALFKLIILPVTMLFVFSLFDLPRIVLLTSVLACACPTAATINLFSIRYGKNYLYASELFALTTMLSLVSIPIVMVAANFVL